MFEKIEIIAIEVKVIKLKSTYHALIAFIKNVDDNEATFHSIFAASFVVLCVVVLCVPCLSAKLVKNCATFCCTLAHFSARRQQKKEKNRRMAEMTEMNEDWA